MPKGVSMTLRRLIDYTAILLLVCPPLAMAQVETPSFPMRQRTRTFYEITDALMNVAAAYRVVIGLEEPAVPERLSSPVVIHLDHNTLAENLSAIVRHQPRYTWRREADGSFLVLRKGATSAVADLTFNRFEIQNLNRSNIEDYLDTNSELSAWLNGHNCTREGRAIVITGSPPQDTAKANFDGDGKSLRENLDEVVRQLGTYFWIITETQRPGQQCRVGIVLEPIIPPSHAAPAKD